MSMTSIVEIAPHQNMTRKRQPEKLDDEDDDDSKKRGRPRVERNDESAADRRRTQIRMAQRAYRQRKESTLDELRRRVDELNGIVDSMKNTFQDCMNRLIQSGLPEYAVNELRSTASRIASLKTSHPNKDRDSSDHDVIIERKASIQSATAPSHAGDVPTPKNVSIWLDQTEVARLATRPRELAEYLDVGLGYSIIIPRNAPEEEQPYDGFRTDHARARSSKMDNGPLEAMAPIVPKEFRPPKTYSFQERSIARRLHRACLEAGYSLLLDPSRNVSAYERVFKLPLLARDRAELIACTRACLDRGPTEPLDLYEAPLIHIGGAGLHYPRRDSNGNLKPRTIAANLGLVGSQTLKGLMQADEQRLSADLAVEIEGLEGDWFDPYDVEGYLAEKGIEFDPTASIAEVQVPSTMRVLGDRSRASSRATTPGLTEGPTPSKSLDAFDLGADWNPDTNVDIDGSDEMTAWLASAQSQRKTPSTITEDGSKKTVMLDVAKFIRGLLKSAVCLGQTPAFRRKNVEKVLALACYDIF